MRTGLRCSVAASVFVFAAAVLPAAAAPIQFSGNGHYYEKISAGVSWAAALAAADGLTYDPDGAGPQSALDGYLVTITSAAENNFVLTSVPGGGFFWTSGTDQATEGVWLWAAGPEAGTIFWNGGPSGSSPTYANWGSGEPNNAGNEDYLLLMPQWNDAGGGFGASYIVEYSEPVAAPVPEPATLLLLGSGLVGAVRARRRAR